MLKDSSSLLPLIVMGVRMSTLTVKFGLTLFVTRFMGLADLGFFGLVSAVTIMGPPFLGCGFMNILARSAVTCSSEELTCDLRRNARFLTLIYMPILIVALGYGLVTGNTVLALLVFGVVVLEHVNQDIFAVLLNLNRPLAANMMHFARAALWALLFMAGALVEPTLRNMEWLMVFWLAGNIVCFAGFFWLARHWPWRTVQSVDSFKSWVRSNFKVSRTIYAVGWVQTAGSYLDRFVISLFLGLELTGVYVLFLSVASALSNLVLTGVIQFARPKMVRAFKEKDTAYGAMYMQCMRNTLLACFALGIPAAAVMYVLVPYLDRPLAVEWFHVLWYVLCGFVASSIVQAQNLVFYSQHRDDLTFHYNGIFLVLMLAFNLILIPILGIEGAAIASIVVPLTLAALQFKKIKCLLSI